MKKAGRHPKVVIVIPNYNGLAVEFEGKGILEQALDSIDKTSYKDYKVVVVDDGSSDSSREFLTRRGVETIALKSNSYNLSKVVNIGIRHALRVYGPKYIVLYTTDVIAKERNWLGEFVRAADSDRSVGMLSCRIMNYDGTLQTLGSFFTGGRLVAVTPATPRGTGGHLEPDFPPSCVCMFTREAIENVGLWDERFIMGWEDGDYSIRMKKAGYRLLTIETTELIHLASLTQKSLDKSSVDRQRRKTYSIIRNDLYIFDKHRDLFTRKQRLNRFALTFFGVSFARDRGAPLGVRKYRSLSNLPTALRAILDYKLGK